MKRLIALLLALCLLAFAFVGCGKKKEEVVEPYEIDSSSQSSLEDSSETGEITGDIQVEIVPAGDESESSGDYFPGYW